jgi:hypothetical protein
MNLQKTIKNWFTSKKRKTQKKQLNCSPIVKNKRVNNNSCFTTDVLLKIKDKYNEKHPDKITEIDPKKIWHELKRLLSCDSEVCWLNQIDDAGMREQIKKFIFAPKQPPEWNSNPDEWLSNLDIEDVAKQYEVSNPEFKLIGPTTIDFDTKLQEQGGKCVLEDLCHFSLERFICAKKTKIGIVFNLDKHYQSGSHWVSMFIDIPNRFIFFFDSADNPIPQEIWQKDPDGDHLPLVNRIIAQGKRLSRPIRFKFYNNRGNCHQRSNTECGMYSLFFIITLLTGKTPFTKGKLSIKARRDMFLQKKIPDNVVFEFRKLYFNE